MKDWSSKTESDPVTRWSHEKFVAATSFESRDGDHFVDRIDVNLLTIPEVAGSASEVARLKAPSFKALSWANAYNSVVCKLHNEVNHAINDD